MKRNDDQRQSRRFFLGAMATGALTAGIGSLPAAARSMGQLHTTAGDEIFSKLKGKYRLLLDTPNPNGIMPFAWPGVFVKTNVASGASESDCSVMLVLRHDAIPYAFDNRIWEKYALGKVFKVDDPLTGKTALKNPFWNTPANKFPVPGLGQVEIDIRNLLNDGVLIGVCAMAIHVWSAGVADGMKLDAGEVKKDWMSGLVPGVEVVPSGLWAVARAQQHGCAYCFAG